MSNGARDIALLLNRALSGATNVINSVPYFMSGERHYRAILAQQDLVSVRRILAEYRAQSGFRDGRKYLNYRWYLRDSVARAVFLRLHESPSKEVLDLGSGAGYFLLACRHFGHEVTGFDVPTNGFYRAMFLNFGLPRIEGRIDRRQPVLRHDQQFDLITAHSVTFARKRIGSTIRFWTDEDWGFFMSDIRQNLRSGGKLFLRLNISTLRGLEDRGRFGCFHDPPPGFRTTILNRREVSLTAT